MIEYVLIDVCRHDFQELSSLKCQHRKALMGIIAPQEYNQTWDCVETAMGKEGCREGRRDGREEQNIPDPIDSSSHCFLDSLSLRGLP